MTQKKYSDKSLEDHVYAKINELKKADKERGYNEDCDLNR